jgi:hypothetical protein
VLLHQEVWDTFQGRNNLFHAIFLWAFAVQTKLDGFIGQVPDWPHFYLHCTAAAASSLSSR